MLVKIIIHSNFLTNVPIFSVLCRMAHGQYVYLKSVRLSFNKEYLCSFSTFYVKLH